MKLKQSLISLKTFGAFLLIMNLCCSIAFFFGCSDDGSEEEGISASPLIEICDDMIDNDLDGLPDDDDDDCHEEGSECSNGIDDDGDGLIDSADPECP